ncbi:MAG: YetF domain-containing protein, partial [Candidatus Eisenbacteria bacterium]
MNWIGPIDWHAVFVPTANVLEIMFRGSVTYLGILAAMRLFRRDAGSLGTADLLLLVLVADAAQNAMSAQYTSLSEGGVLVGTIFAWNYFLDWLSFRYPWAHRVLQGQPLPLVREGRILWTNMRKQLITRDDLMEQLREQGIESVAEVKRAFLEADGRMSVIKRKDDDS